MEWVELLKYNSSESINKALLSCLLLLHKVTTMTGSLV